MILDINDFLEGSYLTVDGDVCYPVEFDGKIYRPQQDAYISNNGETYEARALDQDGNYCMIYWDIICPNSDDGSDHCNWDHPSDIIANN